MRFGSWARVAFIGAAVLASGACGDDDSDGDDGNGSSCAVSSDDCIDGCIATMCGSSVSACSADPSCDMAKDTMVSCVCDAQREEDAAAVDACLSTFATMTVPLATTFANCARANCETACGL